MIDGLLLLILHRRRQMRELLKLVVAGPALVVLCYEVGKSLAPETTVALAAVLVTAAYGAALALYTSKVAMTVDAASELEAIQSGEPVKLTRVRRAKRRSTSAKRPSVIRAA